MQLQPALDNAEEGLIVSPAADLTTGSPETGPPDCLAYDISFRREGHALVESHDEVGTQRFLNLDRRLRRNEMCRTVEMRLEAHTFVRNLAQFCQAENLKAAAVRQNGSRPSGEAMQAAHFFHDLVPRP